MCILLGESERMGIKGTIKKMMPGGYKRMQRMRGAVLRLFKPVEFGDYLNPCASKLMGGDRGMPIDRYYIEYFLQECANSYRNERDKVILEIAENTYSKRFFPDCARYEILTYDKSQQDDGVIFGDLTDENALPENSVDIFICTQTLNFIYDVKSAVHGLKHVLKKGGVALVTVSGISQNSPYDYPRWGDYWRFTDMSLKRMFEEEFGTDNVIVSTYGNINAAVAFLQGISVADLPSLDMLLERDKMYPVTIGVIARKRQE